MIAWELKKSEREIYYVNGDMKLKGRTKLQWYNIQKIREAGGVADFVYPENFEEKWEELFGK